jgi:murein L,D-transpeptidase YafK
MRLLLLLTIILLSSAYSFAGLMPAALLKLDPQFSHHVIVAEKSTHKLHVFRNNDGEPTLVKTYLIATGKKAGNKISQGDYRTPEGIYYLTQFLTHSDLVTKHGKQGEIYGVGAFVLNYPNPVDNIKEKTGGGIWLHSTNDETRIDKGLDSRGCVVSGNQDLIEISKYIELHKTPMIVVHDLHYLSDDAWSTLRSDINGTISTWHKAWQEENIDDYISQYHPQFQSSSLNGLSELKAYKSAIFRQKGVPKIALENISILNTKDYARVTF